MSWTTFSVPECTSLWKLYKQTGKDRSFPDWCEHVRILACKTEQTEKLFQPIADASFSEFDLFCRAMTQFRFTGMRHFFVEAGVSSFCQQSVKDVSPNYRDDTFFDRGPFAVHFRTTERTSSWIVLPESDPWLFFVLLETGMVGIGRGQHTEDWEENDQLRLILGLSLYCQAFPECVSAMPDTPMPWLQGSRRLIGKHELVDAEESRCVSPHYRRGHFRVLRHDRFHEPGRVVFVKGAFVKGTAHYVEPIEDAA